MIEASTNLEREKINKVIERIKNAIEGEPVYIAMSALTAVVALITVCEGDYDLKPVIDLLTSHYNTLLEEAKRGAH